MTFKPDLCIILNDHAYSEQSYYHIPTVKIRKIQTHQCSKHTQLPNCIPFIICKPSIFNKNPPPTKWYSTPAYSNRQFERQWINRSKTRSNTMHNLKVHAQAIKTSEFSALNEGLHLIPGRRGAADNICNKSSAQNTITLSRDHSNPRAETGRPGPIINSQGARRPK